MKSNLFKRLDVHAKANAALTADIKGFIQAPVSAASAVAEVIAQITEGSGLISGEDLGKSLETKTALTPIQLAPVLKVVQFFLSLAIDSAERGDTPEKWASDLADSGVLSAEEAAAFKDRIEAALKMAERVAAANRRQVTSTGVFPSFSGVAHTVEMRGIHAGTYKQGTEVSLYQPAFSGVVGIVSLRLTAITVDQGQSHFLVQMNGSELEALIRHLMVAKRDLGVLSAMVNPNETTSA